MNCQRCGRKAGSDAIFCIDCGAPLELRCPACQTPYASGNRFCKICGRSLPEAGLASELPQPDQPVHSGARSFPCPRCHQRNMPDADYCFACGMPLDDSRGDVQPANAPDVVVMAFPAGFWVRLLAGLIDSLIVIFASFIIAVVLFREQVLDILRSPNFDQLILLLILVYHTVLVAIWESTAGKRLFGLFVVRTDGSRIGVGRAVVRFLAAVLSGLILGIGFLMIEFREDRRGLHDLICDTMVIRRA